MTPVDYFQFTVQFKIRCRASFLLFQIHETFSKPSVPDVTIINKSSWQTKASSHLCHSRQGPSIGASFCLWIFSHKTLVIQPFFWQMSIFHEKAISIPIQQGFYMDCLSPRCAAFFCTMIHYAALLLDVLNHGMTLCQVLCMPTITCSSFKDRGGCRYHYSTREPDHLAEGEVLSSL